MKPLALLVISLLLASCQPDAPPRPDTGTTAVGEVDPQEPCALLSPASVQRAIETEVSDEAEVSAHGRGRICSYGTTEPWASVGVVVEDDVTRRAFDKRLRRDQINTDPVDGIGDGAFIQACVSITVLVDDALVSASVQHFTTCDETAVVLRALGREMVAALRN